MLVIMKLWIFKNSGYLAWVIALVAMLGSLYFSEFAGIQPCILCWYQRIAMYPLVAVVGVGILRKDRALWTYALPLSIIGTGVAFYHNLLQWHVISETLAPCTLGVSCVTRTVIALDFITIPLLSLGAFVLITAFMFAYRVYNRHG